MIPLDILTTIPVNGRTIDEYCLTLLDQYPFELFKQYPEACNPLFLHCIVQAINTMNNMHKTKPTQNYKERVRTTLRLYFDILEKYNNKVTIINDLFLFIIQEKVWLQYNLEFKECVREKLISMYQPYTEIHLPNASLFYYQLLNEEMPIVSHKRMFITIEESLISKVWHPTRFEIWQHYNPFE